MKQYLGDSVYATNDGNSITLTTENGLGGPSNTIYLEDFVIEALLAYLRREMWIPTESGDV